MTEEPPRRRLRRRLKLPDALPRRHLRVTDMEVVKKLPLVRRQSFHDRCFRAEWNYDREGGSTRVRHMEQILLLYQEAFLEPELHEILVAWYRHVWYCYPEPTRPC